MMRSNQTLWLILAGWLAGTLSLSPAIGAEAPAMPKKIVTIEGITEYRLDNGLRLLLFPDSASPTVTVNMTVLVGSRHEGYGETGMAHLLEHMVFKGTPTHKDVPRALKNHNATFNGTTWVDRTNYFETMPATDENLEFGIRLEADRLVNSYVKREDLITEMTVVRNEFESGENDPGRILSQRVLAAAYEWHNYGKSTIGNRSDIERVPIEKLQAFYRKYYQPDNVVLVVAGNFKDAKALELVTKYFGALKKPERELDATYTEEPAQDGERAVTLRRVGTVGVVDAAYHIPAGAHGDFAAVEVLAAILDSEPSGRLYKGLVTAKKATRVSADAYGWHDPGVLEVTVQVGKGESLEGVRDTMTDILEKLQNDKIADDEVNRAKAKLAAIRERLMANSGRIAVTLSDWAAKGDWRLFFLHRDRTAAVTPADVSRVAKAYLQRSNRTVGLYIPADATLKTSIPETPNVTDLVKDYKGGANVASGELFEPTVANVLGRVQQQKLSSGVGVVLLPKKTRGEMATGFLTLRYGNGDSLKGNTSATQFLGALMERGTAKHSRQQIEDELDKLKARISASGSMGDLTFGIQAKRENLPAVLALLGEMLREPIFSAEEFDVIKRESKEALEKSRLDPQSIAVRAMQRKLNPFDKNDIRYVPTVEESIERLDAVTLDQIKKIYTEQLGGENGEFVLVGDFDPEPTVKAVDAALKGWKAKTPYVRVERPAVTTVKGEKVFIETPDKANAVFVAALMLPVTNADPDEAALLVGNYLFGGGPLSSRLANRVRQKEGLSYGVGSMYSADAKDKSGRFMMFAIYNPLNKDKVDAAISEELAKLLKDGVTEDELAEAKKAFLGDKKRQRASDGVLAGLLGQELSAGRTFAYYGDLEKKVEALTVSQVNEALRKHIDPKRLVVVQAGDFKKKAGAPQ
jgi:zinc protease